MEMDRTLIANNPEAFFLQKIVSSAEMQAIDRCAIEEYGIPGMILMENAGRGIG